MEEVKDCNRDLLGKTRKLVRSEIFLRLFVCMVITSGGLISSLVAPSILQLRMLMAMILVATIGEVSSWKSKDQNQCVGNKA